MLEKSNLSTQDMKNYRSVCNLSFISKVTEHMVGTQSQDCLNHFNLTNPLQAAYKIYHFILTAILKLKSQHMYEGSQWE